MFAGNFQYFGDGYCEFSHIRGQQEALLIELLEEFDKSVWICARILEHD
jgi:hypothetical protein